ncbi:MAG: hypothetical protein ACJAZF_003557 [Granulosicoccus sp.]|jgi:hypothetical protein
MKEALSILINIECNKALDTRIGRYCALTQTLMSKHLIDPEKSKTHDVYCRQDQRARNGWHGTFIEVRIR